MSGNKVVKASFWYMACNFLLKGIGFITTPIFSRILTTDEYGVINNFNAWTSIICILVTLSLSSSLVSARFDYKDELESFIKTNLLFGMFVSTVFFVGIYLNRAFWADLFVIDEKYIILMFLTILVNPAYDMFIQVQQFKYKYIIVTILTLIVTLSNIGLSLLFIWLYDDNLMARIIGGQLPVILVGALLSFYFIIKGQKIKLSYVEYSLPIAIPYMFHLLSGTLLNSSDRTMVTKICGTTDNALYSMAYNIALIVNVIWSSMNSAFSPWLGEKLNERNYDKIKKYSYVYVIVFVALAIGVMLISPEVLWILGGEKYINAKVAIPPVMVGCIFIFVYSMYVNIEQFEKKTVGMAFCTIGCALINLFLNWLLIPKCGYVAAAYTTEISYFLLFIAHFIIVKRMNLTRCYDTKFVFGAVGISVIISFIILMLYNFNFLRYTVTLIYSVILVSLLFVNRNMIMSLIKKR